MLNRGFQFLHRHRLFIALTVAAIVVFIISSLLVTKGVERFIFTKLTENAETSFTKIVEGDLAYLVAQGDIVANSEVLHGYIKEKNSYDILALLFKEKEDRRIGQIGVTDENGYVLSRTQDASRRGDNSFISTPYGRVAASGNSLAGITQGTSNPSLVTMFTGRPILDEGIMVGTLFASQQMDDTYATDVINRIGHPGAHVVTFTRDNGIFGSSFTDEDVRTLLRVYFSPGSPLIIGSQAEAIIAVKGNRYFVRSIPLPNVDNEDGVGALLFIPAHPYIQLASLFLVVLVGLLILSTPVWVLVRKTYQRASTKYFIVGRVLIMVTAISVVAFYKLIDSKTIPLPKLETSIYNSTIRLSPESGVFGKQYEQKVGIVVDTGGEEINTVKVTMAYDPKHISVKDIDMIDSPCDFVIEKNIDDEQGELSLACVLLHSQKTSPTFTLGELIIAFKKEGRTTLQFKEDTRVLANDGLATDVLRFQVGASFTVVDALPSIVNAQSATTSLTVTPFSYSHPNSERWYKKSSVKIIWTRIPGAIYRYSFTKTKDAPTDLREYKETFNNNIALVAPGNGVYYFHILALRGGTTGKISSIPLQIDAIPPDYARLVPSETHVKVGSVVRFAIEAEDRISGLAGGYYIKIGDHLLLPVNKEVYVPFPEPGTYEVTARVFDKAGNYTEGTTTITVDK